MLTFAIVKGSRIIQIGSAPDYDTMMMQDGIDGGQVIGFDPQEGIGTETHYWTGEDFAPLPPKPGEWAEWDGSAWIDPRTPSDLAAELFRRRSSALMGKGELVQVLDELRILSPDEVDEVTRGDIPARIEALMEGLSAAARRAAITKWRLDTVISRTHPVIVAAAYVLGITDETMDEIFGVNP